MFRILNHNDYIKLVEKYPKDLREKIIHSVGFTDIVKRNIFIKKQNFINTLKTIIHELVEFVIPHSPHQVLNLRFKGETTIEAAPTTAAPSAGESAEQIYQAQLKYGQPMAQQGFNVQEQFMPQQAALYQALYNQFMPQMAQAQQATQKQLYPYQSQIVEQGAQSALSRLQNPDYMTPQEQEALTAGRGQQVSELQRAMRERANLGGGLYGGRAAGAEARSMTDLLQQFETQDYQRRMSAGQAAQQALTPYMQILYPQVGTQQPQVSPYQYQSAVPSADVLYNALFQSSQPQWFQSQSKPGGVSLGPFGQWGGY